MHRLVAFIFVTSVSVNAVAQSGGFVGGAADQATKILNDQMRSESDLNRQKAIAQKLHDLEMERMRAEYKRKSESRSVGDDGLCDAVRGATIISQDADSAVLGKITNEHDSQSIFNEYGQFGSEYQANSLWNKYGQFGSKYAAYSATNPYSSNPPMIVRRGTVIGYVTANTNLQSAVRLDLLKALCKDKM